MKWTNKVFWDRLQKTFGTAMTLLMIAAGFVNGAFAAPGCGARCCCQIKVTTMHHVACEQTPSSAECCDGNATMPCNLRAGSALPMPVYILTNASANGPGIVEPAGLATLSHIDTVDAIPFYLLAMSEKFQSPPLYLQKSALRI